MERLSSGDIHGGGTNVGRTGTSAHTDNFTHGEKILTEEAAAALAVKVRLIRIINFVSSVQTKATYE